MATVDITETPHVSFFEKRDKLQRILESKCLSNSPKKTRFLNFVSEQTFAGNGDRLNEYLIGVDLHERERA